MNRNIMLLAVPRRNVKTLALSQPAIFVLKNNSTKESLTIKFAVELITHKKKEYDDNGNKKTKSITQDIKLTLKFTKSGSKFLRKIEDYSIEPSEGHPGNSAGGPQEQTFLQIDIHNNKIGTSILPTAKRPIKIPIKRGPGDRIKIKVSNIPAKAVEQQVKEFEFLCRYMSPQQKFQEFLEWQYQGIYAPPKYKYDRKKAEYSCDTRWWHEQKHVVLVSASGDYGRGCVCSPMDATFLGYWFNFQTKLKDPDEVKTRGISFNFNAGKDRKKIKEHYGKYAKLLDTTKINTEISPIAEERLHKISEDFREAKKERARLKNKGRWKPGRKPEHRKIRNTIKLLKKEKKNLTRSVRNKKSWLWIDFLRFLENNSRQGEIFVCANGGHAWLVVVFGNKFTVPKRLIYGDPGSDGNNIYDQPCEKGFYEIQASGPEPFSMLYDDYPPKKKLDTTKAENLQQQTQLNWWTTKWPKVLTNLKLETSIYKKYNNDEVVAGAQKVIDKINNNEVTVIHNGVKKIRKMKVFRGTPLVWRNRRLFLEGDNLKQAYTIDDTGNDEKEVLKDSTPLWVFRVKDVLDPKTGWVKETSAPRGTYLDTFDCRPLIWKEKPEP
jgi:hypothetical protein